ncbi:putative acyl carrier protein [Streptomyces lincolnensis]|uniref:Putative acyl carrier protein n=1 Tax=Streptomyces lincolnensis TaxID=1915 RepID=A0A1B1M1S7_STRLN|nr:acyl carrier protein [Streptomyces lincolnensis]ANS62610.1 putative acyl carrier protein [Streptomyces lincolnensis]AXG51535.1 putative acyl carrier protein [Streptomyces lincolnensis]
MTSPSIDTDLESKVKDIVTDILEIEPEDMTLTSRFKEDHDADSLLAIEILASLEKTFKITIAQEQLVNMVNLQGVCEVVAEAAARRQ